MSGAGKSWGLPASILGAGALVGLGLFFGLSSRTVVPAEGPTLKTAPPPSSPAASERPVAATIDVPRPNEAPVVASAVAPGVRAKAAVAALEAQRKRIVEKCIAPSLAKQPEPKTVKLTFNVTFGADGNEVGRGVSEDRATSRADVTACVQQSLEPLTVPASDGSFTIDLPWELP